MSRFLNDNLEAVYTTRVSHGEDVVLADLVEYTSTFRGGSIRSSVCVIVHIAVPYITCS